MKDDGRDTASQGKRERFLLHVCCAPCSIAVIDELREKYDLSVLFYNPNIFPEDEYEKRKREVVRICQEWDVVMHDQDRAHEEWRQSVQGQEHEPEGGARCRTCIGLRLMKTVHLAASLGIPLFSTTLTMGRRKPESLVTPLGEEAAGHAGVVYYAEDWKKRGREERARAMIKARGIYRQNYCGCEFSIRTKSVE